MVNLFIEGLPLIGVVTLIHAGIKEAFERFLEFHAKHL